jgi:lysine-ketoglutarate reductase/saccharopine dehydrogenase-like protein (TIGR00300 family)
MEKPFLYHAFQKGLCAMAFSLPSYKAPDFSQRSLRSRPAVSFGKVRKAGVAPENYHATSIYPEYFRLRDGHWQLLKESRMDCVVVLEKDGTLAAREFRHLRRGDLVALGRRENGEDGIYVHTTGFDLGQRGIDKFAFRTQFTRETSFSIDYDELYDLLQFERRNGFIVWVLGPAVSFDQDAREAFVAMVERGYVHALLAGNALAVHDVEAALFGTALGQDIYTKKTTPLGHYKHLDAITTVRALGSIRKAIQDGGITDGIMHAVVKKKVACVLAGSIRDDGPLPEVTADVYEAQDKMRALAKRATTVIAMATQLHAIATGNLVPSYRVTGESWVRPVYFYTVDMSEFAVNKLANRGSLTAHSILTNVQDFVVTVERGLKRRDRRTGRKAQTATRER